jgi:hypothetical protein
MLLVMRLLMLLRCFGDVIGHATGDATQQIGMKGRAGRISNGNKACECYWQCEQVNL